MHEKIQNFLSFFFYYYLFRCGKVAAALYYLPLGLIRSRLVGLLWKLSLMLWKDAVEIDANKTINLNKINSIKY